MTDEFNPFESPNSSRNAALIIAAARKIIAENGLEAITRKRVAERAGLSPSEISREFRDRATLTRTLR